LDGKQYGILEANEQLRFDKKGKKYKKESNVSLNALAWFNGTLSFQNESVERITQALEHVYNVEIEFTNPALLKCDYTITRDLNKEPIAVILESLGLGLGIESVEKVNENKFILKGGDKCNPK